MIKKIYRNPQAVIGLLIIIILIFIVIFTNVLAPNDPNNINVLNKYLSPSSQYPLGTDELGRCILSRLLFGARNSLLISFPVLVILSFIGLLLGTLSVCAGSVVDRIVTFICDVFISFPSLVIAISVIAVLGKGIGSLIFAVVCGMWAWFVRMVHAYAQVEMGKDYILAARLSGCGIFKLVFKHLIPNIMPQFIVYISTGIASSIIMVSSFSYLGLGLSEGTPEWGAMLTKGMDVIWTRSEMILYPGICIVITAAGFNLFGEALRDILSKDGDDL